MTALSDRMLACHYSGVPHPYRPFEQRVDGLVGQCAKVLVDAGSPRAVTKNLQARLVKGLNGREEENTFPKARQTNQRDDKDRLAANADLKVEGLEYLIHYSNYLRFKCLRFLLGSAFKRPISCFEFLRPLRGWILVTQVKPAY